jgi:predicted ester cyclase
MSETGKTLVRRLYQEVFNERNLGAVDDLVGAEFTENAAAPFAPGAPGRVEGPSHMRGVVGWLVDQFPDVHFEVLALVADADLVAVRVHAEGTNLGKLNGVIPPTGKRFSADQSHWYRVADGKLAEHWVTRDDLTAMLQLGVLSRPGPPQGGPPNH